MLVEGSRKATRSTCAISKKRGHSGNAEHHNMTSFQHFLALAYHLVVTEVKLKGPLGRQQDEMSADEE